MLKLCQQPWSFTVRVHLKPDGTRWRTGGEVKGKLANGVCSLYSHTTSERGVSSITTADAPTSAASSRLNWRPRRFKWTRPFRWKTKSGFCACAITFQTHSTPILWPLAYSCGHTQSEISNKVGFQLSRTFELLIIAATHLCRRIFGNKTEFIFVSRHDGVTSNWDVHWRYS